jgi:T5SS/PEP-CTERM-associated repeat protein
LILDESLIFDSVQGLNHTWAWTSEQQNVTVNLTPNNGSFGVLGAGNIGAGALTIQGGVAVSSKDGYLGYGAGAAGTATVDGTGSSWTCNGDLRVGYGGSGVLNITHGGTVTVPGYSTSGHGYVGGMSGSAGTVTVDGIGSAWMIGDVLCVGGSGTGVLNITHGGSVSVYYSYHPSYIGSGAGSSGTVTVDGTGSALKCAGTLIIGNSGAGVLNITNGGLVNAIGPTYIASGAGSTGAIHFGDHGGTLTTPVLWGCFAQITGTGTLNIQGLIYDSALVFDGTHGKAQSLAWTNDQANVTVNLTTNSFGYFEVLGAGYVGAGTLTIRDGMAVTSKNGYLGYNVGAAGTAVVDGAGSKWDLASTNLYVGHFGTGVLNLTYGGLVKSDGSVYVGNNTGSAGTVTVDGAGSNLTANSNLCVGYSGVGVLEISNGGSVTTRYGYLGNNSGSAGTVTVDGAGSMLTCNGNGSLKIGLDGAGVLAITNGGAVSSPSGSINSASTVTVDGVGSVWTCSGSVSISGVLNITNGGLVTASGSTSFVGGTSSGGLIQFGDHGGTLTTGTFWGLPAQMTGVGTLNTHGLIYDGALIFDGTHGLNRTWAWTGNQENVTVNLTSVNSTFGDMGVGYVGAGTLTIQDGVAIKNVNGYLGYFTGSSGMATVAGTGSAWTCGGTLIVGNSGTGVLNISNGGSVSSSGSGYLGYWSGSSGTVIVDGKGSAWTWGNMLYVGSSYPGNSGVGVLKISNGGSVSGKSANLGNSTGSSGTVTVDGTGSNFTCTSELHVGDSGTGVLNITNGGAVSSGFGNLGYYTANSSGTVTVDGAGSRWTCTKTTNVGGSGTGVLNIAHGGAVNGGNGNIFSSGTVTVDGAGSTWTCSGPLTIGGSRAAILDITNGGSVNSTYGYLGYNASTSGTALVDGVGSMWGCSGGLLVGASGSGMLTITRGGLVSSGSAVVGFGTGSSGTVTVTGAGSKWTNSGSLTVGNSGVGLLAIADGGAVTSSGGYLGHAGTVTVGGAGSKWTCTGSLNVGDSGTGVLTIANGGAVTSSGGRLDSGTVTVEGAGSTWTCSGLMVSAGVLAITHGGLVRFNGGAAGEQVVGFNARLSGTVMVDGVGSAWICGASDLNVGKNGAGVLTITNGGSVSCLGTGYVGATGGRGSSGVVTVDGSGSTWTCGGLTIGGSGAGTLNITNGGLVTAKGSTYLAKGPSYLPNGPSTDGILCFGVNGGTLTTGTFFGLPAQIKGVGTINANGLVSDGALTFDRAHGINQALAWTSDQANVTVNLTGKTLGYLGVGTLTVRDGVKVPCSSGYVGYNTGSSGMATVDGAGSTWACSGNAVVGYSGTGVLNITNGGEVSCSTGYVGYNSGISGTVTVAGAGSKWTCSGILTVGYSGSGTLQISDGGTVTAGAVTISSTSLVGVNVGDGSQLSLGMGNITSYGTIRLTTAASATAGTYTPISATSWTGMGTVQALGGMWIANSHLFSVSAAAAGMPGVGVGIDRVAQQRVVITDPTSGESVVAGFMGTSGSAPVTLTGWELTAAQEGALVGVVPAGARGLEGWTFAAEGYTAGEPVSLALKVGSGWASENLNVWHFDGSSWTAFAASDLAYDGMYASFTVTGFSGYAVTGVPEPAGLAIMALGAMGLLRRRRRRG